MTKYKYLFDQINNNYRNFIQRIIRVPNLMVRAVKYLLTARAGASFTIEAAIIVPLTFLMIVWLVNASLSIHGHAVAFSDAIYAIIDRAPEETIVPADYRDLIDAAALDGRATLLKYKLLKDGIKIITGGLSDE